MNRATAPRRASAVQGFRLTQFDVPSDGAADVIDGLRSTPKTLPSRFFYDDRGSDLFDRICDLPEYYPTRTEEAILQAAAPEIVALTGPAELVEFGSGSGRKTRLLIEAAAALGHELYYLPIDVSEGALSASARELRAAFPTLKIWGLAGTYEQALAAMPPRALARRLALFLGSTIGNLNDAECAAFLDRVRAGLQPGDFFLVGCDLRKPVEVLEAAYNDAAGVTADFNRNILRHLNRRFDGDFAPERFVHRARYNPVEHQIEMLLISQTEQRASLRRLDLDVSFRSGEPVRTEISRKFDLAMFLALFAAHGFEMVEGWRDAREWFAVTLFRVP
ncbi:MAG TPA: L-histidine N(alpha)-methyltransferase [Alphaproteobacteria bacterium]|jgi:dimethylhistidine N-methyltransferase